MKSMCLFLMICVACLFCGCSSFSKPSASIADVSIQNLSLEKITLGFDVDIQNPYLVALPLSNLKYSLSSGNNPFLSGDAKVQGTVPANGSKIVTVPVDIAFAPLFKALSSARPGSVVPYQANMDLSVDAPGFGPVVLPMQKAGELPIPDVPEVEITNIQWSELSLSKATANVSISMKNKNDFPLEITKFQYNVRLAKADIAQNSLDKPVECPKGQTSQIQIPISVSPMSLGLAFYNVLTGNGADYLLKGEMEIKTPYGNIHSPFEKGGNTKFSKK
ncbi:MAG: LEA type 2 family protein [Candidatus Brocadiae bacterium]|nr:LEA type 2 family protein [Candidatus Brocadiia bacterium]